MSAECILIKSHSYNMTEIIFKNSTGEYPQAQEFDQMNEFGGYSIGRFSGGGTGFIIKICSAASLVVGLILTAAHVFLEDFKFYELSRLFFIGKDTYLAIPLKKSLDWSNKSLRYRDPLTKSRISVPEDWILCEIKKIPGESYHNPLTSISFAKSSSHCPPNTPVVLVGFPKKLSPANLNYFSPEADPSDYHSVERSILEGKKMIKTEGVIIRHKGMIATTCVSCNGMSGSPLLIFVGGKYEVIGLLHGGPASPIHFFVSNLLSQASHPSSLDLDNLLQYLKEKKNHSTDNEKSDLFLKIIKFLYIILKSIQSGGKLISPYMRLLQGIYSDALVLEYKSGNQLKYNLCLPIKKIRSEVSLILSLY